MNRNDATTIHPVGGRPSTTDGSISRLIRRTAVGAASLVALAALAATALPVAVAGAATPAGSAATAGHTAAVNPSATPTLVTRGSVGIATIKVPKTWIACAAKGGPSFCSHTPKTEQVWYDPSDAGQRVTLNVCWGSQCVGQPASGHPTLKVPFPVTAQVRLSSYEIAFHINSAAQYGTYGVNGVVGVAHMGLELAFPVVTATTSVPTSEHSTATAILNSLDIYPPATCGG